MPRSQEELKKKQPWRAVAGAVEERLPKGLADGVARQLPAVRLPRDASALAVPGAIFAVAGLAALAQGASHHVGDPDAAPGLSLAAGFGAALYHLRSTKSLSLPRAAALVILGLAVGSSAGATHCRSCQTPTQNR